MPDTPTPPRSVIGVARDDVERLNRALAGATYPMEKWQLIEHAECDPAGTDRGDHRAILLLWALPAGHYLGLAQVLVGAARTARGHPRRGARPPARLRPAEDEWGGDDGPDGLPEPVPSSSYRSGMRLVRADD